MIQQNRISKLNRLQQKTEKILSSVKNELSICLTSQTEVTLNYRTYLQCIPNDVSDVVVIPNQVSGRRRMATPDYDRLTLHPVKAIIVSHSKSDYDWKRSQQYFEESVHKRRPEKVSMNVEVTIFIICGNCSMTTKYPSESIDM